MRSLRERRMIAAGSPAARLGAERLRHGHVFVAADHDARRAVAVEQRREAAAAPGPSVDARTSPSIAKAMSAPVSALNCAARASSSR